MLNVGQTAFSSHINVLVKCAKQLRLGSFVRDYRQRASSLTCYMIVSVPGAVNVEVSKKHTADRQKSSTKQRRNNKAAAQAVAHSP